MASFGLGEVKARLDWQNLPVDLNSDTWVFQSSSQRQVILEIRLEPHKYAKITRAVRAAWLAVAKEIASQRADIPDQRLFLWKGHLRPTFKCYLVSQYWGRRKTILHGLYGSADSPHGWRCEMISKLDACWTPSRIFPGKMFHLSSEGLKIASYQEALSKSPRFVAPWPKNTNSPYSNRYLINSGWWQYCLLEDLELRRVYLLLFDSGGSPKMRLMVIYCEAGWDADQVELQSPPICELVSLHVKHDNIPWNICHGPKRLVKDDVSGVRRLLFEGGVVSIQFTVCEPHFRCEQDRNTLARLSLVRAMRDPNCNLKVDDLPAETRDLYQHLLLDHGITPNARTILPAPSPCQTSKTSLFDNGISRIVVSALIFATCLGALLFYGF